MTGNGSLGILKSLKMISSLILIKDDKGNVSVNKTWNNRC